MRNSLFSKYSLLVSITITLFLSACGTDSNLPTSEQPPEEELEPIASVAPDGVLETVTWNLEWYGSKSNGPSDDFGQTKHVLRIVDSLDADLYAFQEISSQQALAELTGYMTDYEGLVAEHVSYNQKMAFVYNSNTIEVIESGYISKSDVRSEFRDKWDYYWANGRMPLFIHFRYRYPEQNISKEFYAVTIHGKANTGDSSAEYEESYTRRQKAAEGLYYYLQDHKPNANIIMLGDYNDDVDQSLFYYDENNYAETPYDDFVNDTEHFNVITKKLSDNGESASINYEDIIDHITMSNELFRAYNQGSAKVYDAPQNYISDYGKTTSDHLPVWAKFDVTR